MFKDADDLLRAIRDPRIKMVDLRFCNLFGGQHHLTLPAARIDEKTLVRGEAFDGSSVPGYARLESGDMALQPDVSTAFEDPFCALPTISRDLQRDRGGHWYSLAPATRGASA